MTLRDKPLPRPPSSRGSNSGGGPQSVARLYSWEFGTESFSPCASPPTRAQGKLGPGARSFYSRPLSTARGWRGIVSDLLEHGRAFLGKGNAPLLSEGVHDLVGDLPNIPDSVRPFLHDLKASHGDDEWQRSRNPEKIARGIAQ